MNLQEQISRMKSMMLLEQVTGDTDTIIKQIINKPATIVGDTQIETVVKSVNVKKDNSLDINFKNGYTINLSQNRFRNLNLKLPLTFKKQKEHIFVDYMRGYSYIYQKTKIYEKPKTIFTYVIERNFF